MKGAWATLCTVRWDLADATSCAPSLTVVMQWPHHEEAILGMEMLPTGQMCSTVWEQELYLWNCLSSTLGVKLCALGNSASVLCSGRCHSRTLEEERHKAVNRGVQVMSKKELRLGGAAWR